MAKFGERHRDSDSDPSDSSSSSSSSPAATAALPLVVTAAGALSGLAEARSTSGAPSGGAESDGTAEASGVSLPLAIVVVGSAGALGGASPLDTGGTAPPQLARAPPIRRSSSSALIEARAGFHEGSVTGASAASGAGRLPFSQLVSFLNPPPLPLPVPVLPALKSAARCKTSSLNSFGGNQST